MKLALALLLVASAPLLAAEGEAPADKPINFNVLPPKHEKKKKSDTVRKLTPLSVVCDVDGSTWITKNREDEDRCKMRGGKLRVASGDGHQLPDMQSIPSQHRPTHVNPPTNLESSAPADGTN